MAEYDPAEPPTYDLADESFENGDEQYDQQDADADEEDEDEDYDPSSFTFDASAGDVQSTELMQADHVDAPVAASEQPAKPKTIGGFIVEDDDDEEEEQGIVAPPPSQLNGFESAQSGLGAVAAAEAAEIAAQDVPIASEPQDTAAVPSAQTDTQSARLNGSTPTPVLPVSDHAATSVSSIIPAPAPSPPTAVPSAPDQGKQQTLLSTTDSAPQSTTATPQPPTGVNAAAAPPPQTNDSVPPTPTTQRLPHDKVGQLEDRIKEDPKGDIEAWRGLIAHYREKGQLDNARKIYTRFFKVFPSAVRTKFLLFFQVSVSYTY